MKQTRQLWSLSVVVLVVASTMIGPVVFAGTAMGAQEPGPEGPDNPALAPLDSGATFWQGQALWFFAGEVNAGETWQLREWDEEGEGDVGSLVTEFRINENGIAVLPTEELRGRYVIVTGDGTPVFFRNGTIPEQPTANDPSFEIVSQQLNATFVDGTVTSATGDSSLTDLELRSNRGEYKVVLASDELTQAQLVEIFAANRTDIDDDGQTEVVLTRTVTGPRDALDANFSTVSPGEYEILVSPVDAEVTARATITVREAGPQSVTLNQSVVVEQRGDVATFTLNLSNTDTATVVVGSQELNYKASVRVRDVNDDGQVTLRLNTFVAGRNVAETGGFVAAGPDEILDYNLATEPLTSPLDAARYPVTVNLDGNPEALAALILNEMSLQGIDVWTAPDSAEPGSVQELFDVVTRDDTIAREDWTILQVEASGLYGYLQEPANLNDPSLGLALSIERTNVGPNAEPQPVPLDRVRLIPDPQNNQFFLVLDTNGLEAGAKYNATFTLTEENPYVQQNRSVSTTFEIVERQVTLQNETTDEPLEVTLDEQNRTVITGDSTLAPGSEFDVRIRSAGESIPFIRTTEVTVGENGTWSADFDLPDVPNGTEVQVIVPNYNVTRNAVLVAAQPAEGAQPAVQANETNATNETTTTTTTTTETTTTTTTETTTPAEEETTTPAEEETTTPAEEEVAAGETTTPAEQETTAVEDTPAEEGGNGGIPGFGIGVALVALVATVLLAMRRSS